MKRYQFILLVCVVLTSIVFFSGFMESHPASSWAIVGMLAFLMALGIMVYSLLNWLLSGMLE